MGRETFRGDRSQVAIVLDDGSVLEIDVRPDASVIPAAGEPVGIIVEQFEILAEA
jgi:hypothetical protein